MDETEIQQLIEERHAIGHTADVIAQTYLKNWGSASQPVLLGCSDGRDVVVKGRQNGRMIVNERVVGLLGRLMSAPVGEVILVDLPQALIGAEPALSRMPQGLCHGSLLIRNCSEREALLHTDEPENRGRFARLAVLYGWAHAGDHQFIYENAPPHRVHSVDHGHFFLAGPNWTEASLQSTPPPTLDPTLEAAYGFTPGEVSEAIDQLRGVSHEQIVQVTASVPVDWGLTMQETVTLARYLCDRRDQLC